MAAPCTVVCFYKERLLRAFAHAVSDYNRMHSAQLAAVVRGEDFPFKEEIAQAHLVMEQAKYDVLSHRDEHGC